MSINERSDTSSTYTHTPGEVTEISRDDNKDEKEGPAELSTGLSASRTPAIVAAIVVLVILAVLIVVAILLFNNPPVAAVLRDIFIIFLALQMIIVGLLLVVVIVALIYVALKLYDLVQMLQDGVRPILREADDTARTVRSRVTFISDSAVKPVITVMSYWSATRAIINTFRRRGR